MNYFDGELSSEPMNYFDAELSTALGSWQASEYPAANIGGSVPSGAPSGAPSGGSARQRRCYTTVISRLKSRKTFTEIPRWNIGFIMTR